MPDLSLDFGGDLSLGDSGDLVTLDGVGLVNQRLARRFFTNPQVNDANGNCLVPADYMFHTDYGAGVRAVVGAAMNAQSADAARQRVQKQASLEPGVAPTPAPVATVRLNPGGNELDLYLKYTTRAGLSTGIGFTLAP